MPALTPEAIQPQNVTVKDAAKILGKSEQFVRIGLQRNLLPIGTAVRMSNRWTYHISPKLLEEYVGANALETSQRQNQAI